MQQSILIYQKLLKQLAMKTDHRCREYQEIGPMYSKSPAGAQKIRFMPLHRQLSKKEVGTVGVLQVEEVF